MIEYPAMIYKTNRNRTFIANCIVKNLVGFGKTEEDAINNLKESIKKVKNPLIEKTDLTDINIKPIYGIFTT